MHPYLPHLLSDITAAHRTDAAEPAPPQSIEEHFEEVERWIEGEDQRIVSNITADWKLSTSRRRNN